MHNVEETQFPKKIFATMMLKGKEVKFQVDSGATCNIIPKMYAKDVDETKQVLSMYNNTTVVHLGKSKVRLVNPKNGI